jgi:hypothetical protein
MYGSLARANCLLITTLWSAFKFVMVPIGVQVGALFPPRTFAMLFLFVWGSCTAADASLEILGSFQDVGRRHLTGVCAAGTNLR